jgi:hypothetical protein
MMSVREHFADVPVADVPVADMPVIFSGMGKLDSEI